MPIKILFLVPYPLKESPSQRFRFEQYFSTLEKKGYSYSVRSFLNSQNWHLFFKEGNFGLKTWAISLGLVKRFLMLFEVRLYDFVFIHREATPIGPPIIEWILTKVFRKKIIYDFDDAIWLTDRRKESSILRILKWRSKVKYVCKWSLKVSCGNDYLCSFASKFNQHVTYNPTTVDTENHHNPSLFSVPENNEKIVIGWTGSYSTLKYLSEIEGVLKKMEDENPLVEFIIIADQKPDLPLKNLTFISWNIETEIADLLNFDIGIMPLPDDEWAKGKCGFKLLQYMALKIPSVASPVGVNSTIIDHGINGFLAESPDDWLKYMICLINDKDLRKKIGKSGRKKVIDYYSVLSNSTRFTSLFE
jgi:glycosyltransferase involved in cell wall biosynthesis